MKRRTFIKLAAVAGAGVNAPFVRAAEGMNPFASFDAAVGDFMRERNVPGGALAVVKDRRLVYARGYGFADRERKIPAQPTSLFRIASISKPFTAVAVLRLAEKGRLKLEDRALEIVKPAPILVNGAKPDARLDRITIRQLLHHTGGWDREASFDPMFRSKAISAAAGVRGPADVTSIVRYMLGQPLDFDPGARHAYSNFGYCVLGRVIERVSGRRYAEFVQREVLQPAGIRSMRIGATLDGRQAPGEVRYYTQEDERAEPVFPDAGNRVPWPYGGFHLEAMDAHGGWLASAVDLARFAAAFHEPGRCPLLRAETIAAMHAAPPAPVAREENGTLKAAWYGCGWNVRPNGRAGRPNCWHGGSLPGTHTLLVRRGDGLSWAVLFNQRSKDRERDKAIDPALHRAADAVKEWPAEDLFAQFGA